MQKFLAALQPQIAVLQAILIPLHYLNPLQLLKQLIAYPLVLHANSYSYRVSHCAR